MPGLAYQTADAVRSDHRTPRGFGWSVLPLICRPGGPQDRREQSNVANDDMPQLRLIGEVSLPGSGSDDSPLHKPAALALSQAAEANDERDLIAFGMLACAFTMVLSASGLLALVAQLF